jgi:hypothetical protein
MIDGFGTDMVTSWSGFTLHDSSMGRDSAPGTAAHQEATCPPRPLRSEYFPKLSMPWDDGLSWDREVPRHVHRP